MERWMRPSRIEVKLYQWIANHLPWHVVYFALMRGWANATTGKYSDQDVTTLRASMMIQRW